MFSIKRVYGRLKAKLLRNATYRGLLVPIHGPHVIRPIIDELMGNRYEAPEINALLQVMRPEDRVLEVGVGLGVVSGITAKAFPHARIACYEANPALMEPIRELHALNGIKTIELHNRILVRGAADGPRAFGIHESFAESSLLTSDQTVRTVDVESQSMEDTLAEFRPDVLVIDIEGGEAELLTGLDMSMIRVLVLELHPKVLTREQEKLIYDSCLASGLYPRVELSSAQVVAFERVPPVQAALSQ